jgi:nucleoside-diphosphate-sugar epimerase
MKLLVAGGAGYIGSVLIPKLLARGYDVDVADLFWFGNRLPERVGTIAKDLFHLKKEDLVSYDQVVFLAGLSNDPMAEFSPSQNFIFNAAAPAYLAYIAKGAGVKRYVYASSCSVYGYTENETYDEDGPVTCNYPYGISKLQGERAVLQLADENFSVIALRKGTVSGYSPRMRLDLIVNTMFMTAMRDRKITVNNASLWRPILGIEDAVNAYVRSIEAAQSISGVFNVASGNHTVGEVADIVQDEIQRELGIEIGITIKAVRDLRNYKVSSERAKRVLSFHAYTDVRQIVKDLLAHRASFSDWENPGYYNIRVLRALEQAASEAASLTGSAA